MKLAMLNLKINVNFNERYLLFMTVLIERMRLRTWLFTVGGSKLFCCDGEAPSPTKIFNELELF